MDTLESRGWEKSETCTGEILYTKPGTYGWFSELGAWYHEADLATGLVDQQYPTEVVPKREILSSTLTEKELK
jgi:hypothetical protein